MLIAEDLDNDALGAPAVEFGVEDPLPGAEVEASGSDRKNDLVVDENCFEVGVTIVLTGFVMAIVGTEGGERFQPLVNVVDEAGLVVVDVDSGGDVHGGDEREAFPYAAFRDGRFHLRRDVDILTMLPGVEGEVLGVGFHGEILDEV